MNTKGIILVVGILLLVSIGGYFMLRGGEEVLDPIIPDVVTNGDNNDATTTPVVQHSLIRVNSPLPNTTVSSPLVITGEARGNWYFEASFPVKILDANGKLLGQHYAEAQGGWMTTEFVPFRSTLTFTPSTTATGFLVLEKDNPSGLPENDDEMRIPIRFSNVAADMQSVKLYFYESDRDMDSSGNILCSSQGLVAVNRSIARTNTPIQDTIKELLKGPTTAEKLQASDSEFPIPGLTLTAASLQSGTLTLTFNDPQGKTVGGSCRVGILTAQITATAKQFGGVNTVRYQPSGVFQP